MRAGEWRRIHLCSIAVRKRVGKKKKSTGKRTLEKRKNPATDGGREVIGLYASHSGGGGNPGVGLKRKKRNKGS